MHPGMRTGMRTVTDPLPTGPVVTASFTASRHELFDAGSLLGTAEIARQVCHRADRALSVLSVTPERLRRIDGWIDHDGLVTHATGTDEADRVTGSVCRAQDAPALVEEIIGALVGPLPTAAATEPLHDVEVAHWSPARLPASWAIVITTSHRPHLVVAARNGLVGGSVERLDDVVDLVPIGPEAFGGLLARALAPPPPTVAQMLAD